MSLVAIWERSAGHSRETAGDKPEEGGDDVKSVWSLCSGLHTCYNGMYNGMPNREVEPILKTFLSSDWSLQLDSMKLESLVKGHQLRSLEYVPGPCTHRPSHHGSCLLPKSLFQPVREIGAEGVGGDWDEVVTR